MGDIEVRPCSEQDLEIIRLRWPTRGDIHGSHHARQLEGAATYLVAWRGEEPLGSGMVQWGGPVGPAARAELPTAVEVNHLHVRESFRGQGVGRALVGAAEDLVAQHGDEQVVLGVSRDNPGARRLYLRLGYVPTGVVEVSEYDWTDDEGVTHHAVEHDEILVKALTWGTPSGAARD